MDFWMVCRKILSFLGFLFLISLKTFSLGKYDMAKTPSLMGRLGLIEEVVFLMLRKCFYIEQSIAQIPLDP